VKIAPKTASKSPIDIDSIRRALKSRDRVKREEKRGRIVAEPLKSSNNSRKNNGF